MPSATRFGVPNRLASTGMRMALRLLEENRRTFGTQHAVADFGHFEAGIDLDADALQLAGLFQLRHEVAQVVIFHRVRKEKWQATQAEVRLGSRASALSRSPVLATAANSLAA